MVEPTGWFGLSYPLVRDGIVPFTDSYGQSKSIESDESATVIPSGESLPMTTIELLAPAGNIDCARAAIENGADAIYFGLDLGFNARARAANISLDNLDRLMELVHGREARGYCTLNTLIFPSELERIEQTVRYLAQASVDAILVQDFGAAILIRAVCPEMAIHASTQMTLTSAECLAVAERLGIQRAVLARELSLPEILQISKHSAVELETFVHGALCVAYSGQCMTSESLGGRSANRGQCAQACRLPYELVCDGKNVDLGDMRYLLSPQDLAAYELIADLLRAGVRSFKIEGRLKTPEYVANVVQHYRQVIDQAMAGRTIEFSDQRVAELELSFSRGFSPGWLGGCDHKMLVPGTSSAKRGVLIGHISALRGPRIQVNLCGSITRGDGVAFESQNEATTQGGRIYEVFCHGRSISDPVNQGTVELTFSRGEIQLDQLHHGQAVWKTDDPKLTKRLRKSFSRGRPNWRVSLRIRIRAEAGARLCLTARTRNGVCCEVLSEQPLKVARTQPATNDFLRQQLDRLGNTHYRIDQFDTKIQGRPMVPLSVFSKMRREMVQRLDQALTRRPPKRVVPRPVLSTLRPAGQPTNHGESSRIHVLCRSLQQLDFALSTNPDSVMVDFPDVREYKPAVASAHLVGIPIFVATPRIQKPDEMGIIRVLPRHEPDGLLVRNLAGLEFCREEDIPCVADFSLNVTNELAAQFVRNLGARRVTVSYDLNRDQILDLISAVPSNWLEVVIHQHMPMFHMEHCVFCAVLSPGTDKTNCGRPCDVHTVQLRDRVGMEHTLTADVGCRNTLFNAVPQSAAEVVPVLVEHGVKHFRIELLNDTTPTQVYKTISLYRELLDGKRTAKHVWNELRATNRLGVTRGTLEERRNPLAII